VSLKNKEVMNLINSKTKEMEKNLNVIEDEIQKPDEKFNRAVVAVSVGKLMKLHQQLAYFLGVHDDEPKYIG
jgi:hypothetical protein